MSTESISTIDRRKRVRSPNFTPEETRLLLRLALNEKHILENKKTDSDTWKLKVDTWKRIANTFNSTSGISGKTLRSVNTLRGKYDSIKKELKKKINRTKVETMKVGSDKPDYVLIDGPEKDLLEVLSLSVHDLASRCDSDTILHETVATTDEVLKFEDEEVYPEDYELIQPVLSPETESVEEYELPVTFENSDQSGREEQINQSWKNWPPASLKTKKHSALTPRKTERDVLNKKMDTILQLREELLRSQIDHVKNEERRAQEKHEKEMELLDVKILNQSKKLGNN